MIVCAKIIGDSFEIRWQEPFTRYGNLKVCILTKDSVYFKYQPIYYRGLLDQLRLYFPYTGTFDLYILDKYGLTTEEKDVPLIRYTFCYLKKCEKKCFRCRKGYFGMELWFNSINRA